MNNTTDYTITAEITAITARRHGGYTLDNATLSGYNLGADDVGKYAVIQHGYACLGTGETEEEAIADAERNCGEEVVIDADPHFDGALEIVLIEAAE